MCVHRLHPSSIVVYYRLGRVLVKKCLLLVLRQVACLLAPPASCLATSCLPAGPACSLVARFASSLATCCPPAGPTCCPVARRPRRYASAPVEVPDHSARQRSGPREAICSFAMARIGGKLPSVLLSLTLRLSSREGPTRSRCLRTARQRVLPSLVPVPKTPPLELTKSAFALSGRQAVEKVAAKAKKLSMLVQSAARTQRSSSWTASGRCQRCRLAADRSKVATTARRCSE